jgi:hypothetical protein
MTPVLRQHAEIQCAHELEELQKADNRQRPTNWALSPWAVTDYLLGVRLDNGFEVTPKYIGSRRLMEIAVATLATDRAAVRRSRHRQITAWQFASASGWPPPPWPATSARCTPRSNGWTDRSVSPTGRPCSGTSPPPTATAPAASWDLDRAERLIPTLSLILGVETDESG